MLKNSSARFGRDKTLRAPKQNRELTEWLRGDVDGGFPNRLHSELTPIDR